MDKSDKDSGCPYSQVLSLNSNRRAFFTGLKNFHLWEMGSEDFWGFPGAMHGNMKADYDKRIKKWVSTVKLFNQKQLCTFNSKQELTLFFLNQQPEHYAVKKKNIVLPSDVKKVKLSILDESDPIQHIQKVMTGCGIYFAFRGRDEHSYLRQSDAYRGYFEPEHACAGRKFVGIGGLKTDKKHKVSTHNNYVRDTENIMRIPVLDEDSPDDFAASFLRYLDKLNDHQERMYCYPDPKKSGTSKLFFDKKPIGKEKIHDLQFDTARIMGLDLKHFRGGHAWRHFAIQGMVNDPNVPLQESMKAARHSSVSVHLAYMSSDFVTEGKKIAGLLRRNNAVQEPKKEEVPKPLDTCKSKSTHEPIKIF